MRSPSQLIPPIAFPASAAGPPCHVAIVGELPEPFATLVGRLAERGVSARSYESAECILFASPSDPLVCVVASRELSGEAGLRLQQELRWRMPAPPLVVVAEQADVGEIIRAFEGGARGYFLASSDFERLVDSVHRLFGESAQRWQHASERQRRLDVLSEREREVLDLLVAGQSVKTIARDLGIRPSTAEKHRARILLKTRFDTVIELVSYLLSSEVPPSPAPRSIGRRIDPDHHAGACHFGRQPIEAGVVRQASP